MPMAAKGSSPGIRIGPSTWPPLWHNTGIDWNHQCARSHDHTSWRADTRTRWQHFQEGNVSLHFQTLTLTLVVWFPHPLLNIYFFNSTSLQTSTELQILHWQCTSAHDSPSIVKKSIQFLTTNDIYWLYGVCVSGKKSACPTSLS